jgi:hypothetical protein
MILWDIIVEFAPYECLYIDKESTKKAINYLYKIHLFDVSASGIRPDIYKKFRSLINADDKKYIHDKLFYIEFEYKFNGYELDQFGVNQPIILPACVKYARFNYRHGSSWEDGPDDPTIVPNIVIKEGYELKWRSFNNVIHNPCANRQYKRWSDRFISYYEYINIDWLKRNKTNIIHHPIRYKSALPITNTDLLLRDDILNVVYNDYHFEDFYWYDGQYDALDKEYNYFG